MPLFAQTLDAQTLDDGAPRKRLERSLRRAVARKRALGARTRRGRAIEGARGAVRAERRVGGGANVVAARDRAGREGGDGVARENVGGGVASPERSGAEHAGRAGGPHSHGAEKVRDRCGHAALLLVVTAMPAAPAAPASTAAAAVLAAGAAFAGPHFAPADLRARGLKAAMR